MKSGHGGAQLLTGILELMVYIFIQCIEKLLQKVHILTALIFLFQTKKPKPSDTIFLLL